MDYYRFFFNLFGYEFVTQLFFVSLLFVPWKRRRNFFFLRYAISFGLIAVFGHFVPIHFPWNYLEGFILLVCAIAICFKGNFVHALYYSVNIYCIQYIISAISYSVTYFFILNRFTSYNFIATYKIVSLITMATIIIATLFLFTLKRNNYPDLYLSNPVIVYATALFLSVAVFLSHYGQQTNLKIQIYIKVISLLYAVSTIVINEMNCLNKKLQNENSILQILLKKDQEKYELAKLNSERLKIKYHDLKHRLSQGYMDNEEAQELDEENKLLQLVYHTGNKALDIILYEKSLMCKKNGIRLICTADGNVLNFMKSHHIYSLLGNAFDNAIESLLKVKDYEKKEIRASITRRNDMCIIKISNYMDEKVVLDSGLPQTTKGDPENHGYGLKSIKNIVEQYGAELYLSTKNKTFNLLIAIPKLSQAISQVA